MLPESGFVSSPAYWSRLYRSGGDGWEKGRPAPPILRLARDLPPGRVAVIGCGRGHEAVALADLGWETIGFDFAPEAIAAARRLARRKGSTARFEAQDLFDLPHRYRQRFNAVCEHTCFCAIDPARRVEYARAVAAILKAAGRFFGLFYAHGNPGGPPFSTDAAEVRRLFAGRFLIERLEVPPDSFLPRQGKELLAVFRKRAPVPARRARQRR